MTDLLNEILATLAFAGVGLALLALGYLMLDLLTPGHLGTKVFVEHRRDAAVVLGSSLISLGGIIAMAIYTSESSTWVALLATTAYGLVGVALLGLAFLLLDVLTPGDLRAMVTDEKDDPAVWVIAASQVAIGLVVVASLT